MQAHEDRLFERWCRRADARALGELFDLTAPRLFKLAVHLVGDAAEAEDLVQASFVVAIEERERVDPSRPVMPWLSGVLAHKAQQHRRRAARAVEPQRLAERAVEDPSRPLERRELDGEVAAAIDQLGEPYRQVLVLRLRHAMEPADIAHVLERDPGTVRVQLHRGVEKLRALLPAALATALFVGLVVPRGLAAVKVALLEQAALATAAATSTSILGGLIVSKQVLVAAAVLAAIVALVLVKRASNDAAGPGLAAPAQLEALAAGASHGSEIVDAPHVAPVASSGDRSAVTDRPSTAHAFRGKVVDAESGGAIGGASVRVLEPRETTALELVRERPELFELKSNGKLRARTWGDWPQALASSAGARFGREQLVVYDPPGAGVEPLEETLCDADGRFALEARLERVTVEISAAGYATRYRVGSTIAAAGTIALWRERELRGVVIGPDGRPVPDLQLAFNAFAAVEREPEPDGRYVEIPDTEREALGTWTARSDADGRFALRVGAPSAMPAILSSGWGLPAQRIDVGADVRLFASRLPVFHFFDAVTHAPIECVRILGRNASIQYVQWSGEFAAPGGLLTLPGDSMFLATQLQSALSFEAWADGYEVKHWTVPARPPDARIEVALQRGDVAEVRGVVLRGGAPADGAEVALLGLSGFWRPMDEYGDWLIDAERVRADGRFALRAPAGRHLLRVKHDDVETYRAIEAPAELEIELEQLASIEVEIVDALGSPREGHVVGMHGDDGRQSILYSGADGRVLFDGLPRGSFRVSVPYVTTQTSFTADELRQVEIVAGARERVRIELPPDTGPRHARVVAEAVTNYSGWRARYDEDEWNELENDGTIPMDLATERFTLLVASPRGRVWSLAIPKDADDGHEIRLEAGAAAYRGELLDGQGAPLAGVWIHAIPQGACRESTETEVSCRTDARGAFELDGLAPCNYSFRFQTGASPLRRSHESNELDGLSFTPSAAAAADPTFLSIRIERPVATVRLSGVVRRADGTPAAQAMLYVECEIPAGDGTLRVGGRKSFVHADGIGEFDVALPRTPRRVVRVYPTGGGKPVFERAYDDAGLDEERLEISLP